MKYEERIAMPTEEEINGSIDFILSQGMNARSPIRLNMLSPRQLIFGIEDCVVIAVMAYVLLMAMFSFLALKGVPLIPMVFLLSPLLFAGMLYLSMWKDIMNKTVEWKQACRINYKLITVHRMILFGGASLIMNAGYNLILWNACRRSIDFLWILSFSFASLFLYGLLSLWLMNKNMKFGIVILTAVWAIISGSMFMFENIMTLVTGIPLLALVIDSLCLVGGVLYQINEYMHSPMKGDFINAYN